VVEIILIDGGLFMNRRRNTKKRRQRQLLCSFIGILVLGSVLITMSAGEINAESDLTRNTYKYYTTIYVERGDSLWSIAKEYTSKEYKHLDDYIDEVIQINHLNGSNVQHGTYICVPYYSTEHK